MRLFGELCDALSEHPLQEDPISSLDSSVQWRLPVCEGGCVGVWVWVWVCVRVCVNVGVCEVWVCVYECVCECVKEWVCLDLIEHIEQDIINAL